MRKVELRMNEKEKYNVVKELVDHNGNKNRACKKLGISRRQIDRLIIIYKEKGKIVGKFALKKGSDFYTTTFLPFIF